MSDSSLDPHSDIDADLEEHSEFLKMALKDLPLIFRNLTNNAKTLVEQEKVAQDLGRFQKQHHYLLQKLQNAETFFRNHPGLPSSELLSQVRNGLKNLESVLTTKIHSNTLHIHHLKLEAGFTQLLMIDAITNSIQCKACHIQLKTLLRDVHAMEQMLVLADHTDSESLQDAHTLLKARLQSYQIALQLKSEIFEITSPEDIDKLKMGIEQSQKRLREDDFEALNSDLAALENKLPSLKS